MTPSRMNRRDFLQTAASTAGAATLGGALAACGGTGSAAGSTSGTVTLNYWDLWVNQAPWVDNEIKLFQQAHPNIKIKKTTHVTDTYDNLFALAVQSQNEPDVFMIPNTPTFPEIVKRGWLMPLDKWATPAWKSRFPSGTFSEHSNMVGGKTYSAPISGNAPWLQFYINNSVFRNAGLTNADGSIQIPQTWDDVTRAADAITKKSNGQAYGLGFGNAQNFILGWWVELFVRGAGANGGAYSQDYRTGKWTYATDPTYENFINLMLEWKSKGYFYPNSMSSSDEEARAAFERGKFGMTVGGVWNQAEWTTHNFTDYSLMTLPTPDSSPPKGYFYYGDNKYLFGISARTRHPEEAWAWFDWLYSVDAGKRWAQDYAEDLSVFPQNNDPTKIKSKPFAQYVATTRDALFAPYPALHNPETAFVVQATFKPDINDVIAGIYTGQIKDIPGALTDLAARYQNALDTGIKQAQQQGHRVSFDDYVFADWDPTKPYTPPAS